MRPQLLGVAAAVAAIAYPAAPAQADGASDAPFAAFGAAPAFGQAQSGAQVRIHRGAGSWNGGDGHRGDHRRHRRDRGDDNVFVGDGWGYYGGEWALYNNRSWESDSYNDWWHDQPWRSYPRWVTQNQGCDRQWYSGDVLRC